MQPSDELNVLNQVKSAIGEVRAAGRESVNVDALDRYVDALIGQTQGIQTRQEYQEAQVLARATFERDMKVYEVQAPLAHAQNIEMFRSVIEAGSSALKAAMITNGGAALALLAFVGNTLAKAGESPVAINIDQLSNAMLVFFMGTSAAALSQGFRYITQYCYHKDRSYAVVFHVLGFLVGIASFVLFMVGGWFAHSAFT